MTQSQKFTTDNGITGFYPPTVLNEAAQLPQGQSDLLLSRYRGRIERLHDGAEGMLLESRDAHEKFTAAREVEEVRTTVDNAVTRTVSYLGIADITLDTQKAVTTAVMASVWQTWKVDEVEKG